jgi:hypothetical protein
MHKAAIAVRGVGLAFAATLTLAACGVEVAAPDLFVLTRTGPGGRLTMLVNYGGTIRCNGGATKPLPDPLLLQARDLANTLDSDAKKGIHIPAPVDSVYSYRVSLANGTISFPDTAAAEHGELAQTEQFVLAAEPACGLSG